MLHTKKLSLPIALVVSLATTLVSGCFTTRLQTGLRGDGTVRHGHQWFTLGGLVDVFAPTKAECPAGIAASESSMAVGDVLVNVGLSVAGALVGVAVCSDDNRSECASYGASIAPFWLARRTVRYVCAAPPGGKLSLVPTSTE